MNVTIMKRREQVREYRTIQARFGEQEGMRKQELLLVYDAEIYARLNNITKSLHDIKKKYDVGIAAVEPMELHHYGALVREHETSLSKTISPLLWSST